MTNKGAKLVRLQAARKSVVVARRHLDDANVEYVEAIVAAHDAGFSFTEIGRVLGVSRQAARQFSEKGRKS